MSRIKSVKAISTTVAAVLAVVALVVGLGIGALALGGLAGPREVTVTRTVVSTVTQTGAGATVTVTQTATVTAPGADTVLPSQSPAYPADRRERQFMEQGGFRRGYETQRPLWVRAIN
jgi:hypothetical protein